ncbi:MAG: YggS family pyridoxal phosphate-dependent enzyme [Flavitalea sp.]
MVNKENYHQLINELDGKATLVAVSKFKTAEDIMELYQLGQRDFGENYVQELMEKQLLLPKDIRWHFIGHLQSNKIKFIAPFIQLVESIDSLKLLGELQKQAKKANRVISCLLQVHIASEETKFGLDENELQELIAAVVNGGEEEWRQISITGLMGMASFSDDERQVRTEFRKLKTLYDTYSGSSSGSIHFSTLSMGMSGDYSLAVEEGSTEVRVGSLLFGKRS